MTSRIRHEQPVHSALLVMQSLPVAVTREQRARGLSLRQAAVDIGVPVSVLSTLVRGADVRLSTVIKCLEWLDTATARPTPDTLTGAARVVLDLLTAAHQLGQSWLRVEPRSFGLLVPDPAGTLGELSRVRGLAQSTWGELEAAGLVRRGLPAIAPPARGPRNRNVRNEGWPVEIITTVRTSDSVMLDTTQLPTEETSWTPSADTP